MEHTPSSDMQSDHSEGETHHQARTGRDPVLVLLLFLREMSIEFTLPVPLGYILWVTLGLDQDCVGSVGHWAREYMQKPQLGFILALSHVISGGLLWFHAHSLLALFDGKVYKPNASSVCMASTVAALLSSVLLRCLALVALFPPADMCPSNEDSALGTFARSPCRNHSGTQIATMVVGTLGIVVDCAFVGVLLWFVRTRTRRQLHSTEVDASEVLDDKKTR